MSISELTPMPERARRIEVFTGAGRRRNWPADEKAAIVAESYAPNQGANLWPASRQAGFRETTLLTSDVNSEAAAVDDNTAAASARAATNALRLRLLKSLRLSRRTCRETASWRNERYEPDWAGCRNVMALIKISSARASGPVTTRAACSGVR